MGAQTLRDTRDGELPAVPTVTAVARSAQILEAVASADGPLTAGRLARDLGLPRSTTLGLCVTLAETGLLHRSADGGYRLGRQLIHLAHKYAGNLDVVEEFQTVCRELKALPSQTMLLSVRDGRHITSVAKRPGSGVFGLEISVGRRVPAHATGMGKAMIASLSDEELEALYLNRPLEGLTENTITQFEALRDEVLRVRTQGYAVDNEETTPGLLCIGASVLTSRPMSTSVAVAAVGVALVKSTVDDESFESAVEGVRLVAAEISARLP